MKQKLFLASSLAAILAFSASCGDEIVGIEAPPPEVENSALGDTNFVQLTRDEMTVLRTMDGQSAKISQDEAIDIASKLLGREKSLSKSAGAVRCEVLTRPSSRISKSGTSEADTMMYLLNFGNNDGYALVCADVRVPDQILAYSDTGEMDSQTDNPGVQMFMEMAQDYMDYHIAEVERKRDSLEEVVQGKIAEASDYQASHLSKSKTLIGVDNVTNYESHYHHISDEVKPMLRTYWRQKSPYNNYVPECNDASSCENHDINCESQSLAGCVAVAAGQLMAYWRYPNNVGGVRMNWETMQFESLDAEERARKEFDYWHRAATLLRVIGANICMKYGCGGSETKTVYAVNWLSRLGYHTEEESDYSLSGVVSSLKNGCPLIITGCRVDDEGESHGHAWLIDGYVEDTQENVYELMYVYKYMDEHCTITLEPIYSNSRFNTYANYVHCNWGWGNISDGYYRSGVFDTFRKCKYMGTGEFPEYNPFKDNPKAERCNYCYYLTLFKNIYYK